MNESGSVSVGVDELLKPVEAANVLKVSRAHLGALVRSGSLQKVSIGTREYRISRAALAEWIKANTCGGTEAARG